jgi:hypothetical protein
MMRARMFFMAAAMAALNAAENVSRTPVNGILINGPGGTPTLFSQ